MSQETADKLSTMWSGDAFLAEMSISMDHVKPHAASCLELESAPVPEHSGSCLLSPRASRLSLRYEYIPSFLISQCPF